jgi:hypothetical protein
MNAANGSAGGRFWEPRYVLAGLQAGVIGCFWIFACVMTGALLGGRSIWVVPNLFATTFFGSGVYRDHFLRASLAGTALIVAIYGGLGVVWGCIWRDRRRRWLRFYGAVAGLGVYYLFFHVLWRYYNPLLTLYAPDRQLELGHLLWGMVLAGSPLYARRIMAANVAAHVTANVTATTLPVDVHGVVSTSDPEVRSGEVIR